MPRKLLHGPERRTHPLVWFLAMVCTIISVVVIVSGLVVFVGYLIIHPSVPVVSVAGAHMDGILNDPAGRFDVQLTIVMRAENDNSRAHASFSDYNFILSFRGIDIAVLHADAFEVAKNGTQDLPFPVVSNSIPLGPEQMEEVDLALKQDLITFDLKGHARARWKVGLLGSVKFSCNLNCQLKFHPITHTYMNSPTCTSRAK